MTSTCPMSAAEIEAYAAPRSEMAGRSLEESS
jgi:hypothetical protein